MTPTSSCKGCPRIEPPSVPTTHHPLNGSIHRQHNMVWLRAPDHLSIATLIRLIYYNSFKCRYLRSIITADKEFPGSHINAKNNTMKLYGAVRSLRCTGKRLKSPGQSLRPKGPERWMHPQTKALALGQSSPERGSPDMQMARLASPWNNRSRQANISTSM